MTKRLALLCAVSTLLAGCYGRGLSPPQITGEQQANVAIQEFLAASVVLARVYHLTLTVRDADPQLASSLSNASADLFGYRLRVDVPYEVRLVGGDLDRRADLLKETGAVQYYIRTGAHASMILCRNYLSGLRDRNEYFEFLQQELKIAGGLTNLTLGLLEANNTLHAGFKAAQDALHSGLDTYQTFRYLTPDIETILPVVETAQVRLGEYFVKNPPKTFAGAIDAVSRIEYQCSRSGVRGILNKALVQAVPNFDVKAGGILVATPAAQPKGK